MNIKASRRSVRSASAIPAALGARAARSFKLLVAVGLAALLVAVSACSDDIVTSTATTTTQAETTTTASSTTVAPPSDDVSVSIGTTTPPPPPTTSTTASDEEETPEENGDPATTTTYELAEVAFNSRSRVTTVGIDEVYFGTWFQDAAAAARTEWVGIPEGTIPECLVVTPINGPEGIDVWLWQGYVERIDLTNPDIRTRSGYGVGTTLETLMENLGEQLEVEENEDGSKTATFVPVDASDAVFRIVFELDFNDEVTSYRSGRASLINRTKEAC